MINDKPNLLLNIICFFFPWIGLIVYLVIKDASPRKARSLGKASIAGGILYLAVAVLITVIVQRFIAPSFMQVQMGDVVDEIMK